MPYVKKDDGTFGFARRLKRQKKGIFIAVSGTDQDYSVILATVKGFFKIKPWIDRDESLPPNPNRGRIAAREVTEKEFIGCKNST